MLSNMIVFILDCFLVVLSKNLDDTGLRQSTSNDEILMLDVFENRHWSQTIK